MNGGDSGNSHNVLASVELMQDKEVVLAAAVHCETTPMVHAEATLRDLNLALGSKCRRTAQVCICGASNPAKATCGRCPCLHWSHATW